jgi:hypothetical protein
MLHILAVVMHFSSHVNPKHRVYFQLLATTLIGEHYVRDTMLSSREKEDDNDEKTYNEAHEVTQEQVQIQNVGCVIAGLLFTITSCTMMVHLIGNNAWGYVFMVFEILLHVTLWGHVIHNTSVSEDTQTYAVRHMLFNTTLFVMDTLCMMISIILVVPF